jgi:undecaprenyl diphosphate synthase
MIYWIYEQMLLAQIKVLPRYICFMISGDDMAVAPGKIAEITGWCNDLNSPPKKRGPQKNIPAAMSIEGLTFHISEKSPETMARYMPNIRNVSNYGRLILHYGTTEEVAGSGLEVVVAIGKSGREEITDCIRRLAETNVPPSEIDEKMLESCLTFKYNPDIVVKTGGDHLTDFLIWQSVYSELFFSDVNWKYFRRVDFLRILRDYQSRMRRFGK